MEIIPSQVAINSIALYYKEFDNNERNYNELLELLKVVILQQNFMQKHDTTEWMQTRGIDYLSNPKLFCHAPLTCLCAFLGELFTTYNVKELQEKLPPEILKCALVRLSQFKSS
jgi:hypothetical protein